MRTAAALLALCAALAAQGADWTLATLFEALAKERAPRARFEETRHLALLDRPLVSTGELRFTPPSRLEKRTETPRPERMVVDGDRVTLERGGKTLALGLAANPAVAVLVDSIRGTLAGDLAAVTRTYSAALEGGAARWRLRLRPLDPAAATLVERVEIAGSHGRVQSVEVVQADGDRSVMTITALP